MALENDKFNSLDDLYNRVLPALITKKDELKKEKLRVSEKDIWNYCVKYKFSRKKDLRIHELVDEILNADAFQIELYIRKNLS